MSEESSLGAARHGSLWGRPMMIGARVRVANEDGHFTTVVFAESLREVELTAKNRYPGSHVKIAFPIEPECFFAGGPRSNARGPGGAGNSERTDVAVVRCSTNHASQSTTRLA